MPREASAPVGGARENTGTARGGGTGRWLLRSHETEGRAGCVFSPVFPKAKPRRMGGAFCCLSICFSWWSQGESNP